MSRVWLITGSSRGLGRALAEAVLASGDNLVATARDPGQLADLSERYGDQVLTLALDVTDEAAAAAAVEAGVKRFGRIDVLVNNAGYGNVGSIEDTSLADFRAQIETNLFGTIIMTKAVIALMRGQGAGTSSSSHPSAAGSDLPGAAPIRRRNSVSRAFPRCWRRRSRHSGSG